MQLPTIPKIGRLTKTHKITAAGAAAAAAVVLAVTGLQATGGTASASASAAAVGDPTGFQVTAEQQAKSVNSIDAQAGVAKQRAVTEAAAKKKAAEEAAKKKAAAEAAAKKKAAEEAAAKKKAAADAAAKKAAAEAAAKKKAAQDAAAQRAKDKAAANRSTTRTAVQSTPQTTTTYSNDLDGWIKQSLAIMAQHGIPGSYDGIYRNIMRESSGNPQAINLYDSNAAAGIPSKGLLQVIDPTFQAYHVDGTSWDIYDPVANITAACNYAAANYGSMDNVDSAY